jgi:hypothetical protein
VAWSTHREGFRLGQESGLQASQEARLGASRASQERAAASYKLPGPGRPSQGPEKRQGKLWRKLLPSSFSARERLGLNGCSGFGSRGARWARGQACTAPGGAGGIAGSFFVPHAPPLRIPDRALLLWVSQWPATLSTQNNGLDGKPWPRRKRLHFSLPLQDNPVST